MRGEKLVRCDFLSTIIEIYLVARRTSIIRVEHESISLSIGDMIVAKPGEAHTFLESSSDYLHIVIHVPNSVSEKVRGEKTLVLPERLGLKFIDPEILILKHNENEKYRVFSIAFIPFFITSRDNTGYNYFISPIRIEPPAREGTIKIL